MRKTGIAMLFTGVFLALLLYLARQSAWFAAEQARGFSDFAELVESSFWAALVTVFLGLVFLLLSYRVTAQLSDNDVLSTAFCPGCGTENPAEALRCAVCGNPRNNMPNALWRCPVCGKENPEQLSICQLCQTAREQRPVRSWICDLCGHKNPETEDRCTACLHRRNTQKADWICPICGTANARKRG